MDRETTVRDASFGFTWGAVEGEYFLRNDDADFKSVSENIVLGLREAATEGTEFDAVVARVGESNPDAAETLRGLSDEGFVRSDEAIERIYPPDDIRLWPRTALFLVLLSIFVGVSVSELRSSSLVALTRGFSHADFAVTIGSLLVLTAIHEYGHYRASKPYFDASMTVGTINAVVPTMKTVTTEAWLLPTNLRRWISLAGPLVELVACLPLVVVHYAVVPGDAVVTMIILGVTSKVVFALNPLYHGDGYWLFLDTFGISGLKSRGVSDLRNRRPTWPALYGVLSYGFAIVVTGWTAYYASRRFGLWGGVFAVGVVGLSYFVSFAKRH